MGQVHATMTHPILLSKREFHPHSDHSHKFMKTKILAKNHLKKRLFRNIFHPNEHVYKVWVSIKKKHDVQ